MNDKKWIKAEDVAKLAGVSRSAVSRAFTPGASVSPKTRAKVQAAAETLGYQVNIIARTMNTGSSNFIGIITSGFDNPFRSKLLAPLIHQLALHGFMPLLMNADDPQQLAPSLKHLLSYHVAGVIITSGAPPLELAEEYLARKIPVTLINRHAELPGCDRVSSDNALGGKLAAELLHAGQCRDVGFIGENRDNFSTRQRYEGFIHHASGLAVTAHFCETGGYQSGLRPLAGSPRKGQDCRRCFALPICWRLGRWMGYERIIQRPSFRQLLASTIFPRRSGNPINLPLSSRTPRCWLITRWRCWLAGSPNSINLHVTEKSL